MRIAAALLLGACIASSQTVPETRGGNDRILNLNQRIRAQPDAAGLRALLEERARLFGEVMERDPRAAVDSALPGELLKSLARQVPDAAVLLEESGEWTGPLVTSVEDDFEHGRSRTVRVIHARERDFNVFWADPPSAGCSPSATVRGVRLGDRIAVTSGEMTPQAGGACATTGDQKTVVILVSYPSTPLPSGFTQSYVYNTFFGPAPSVTDFWREVSYGRASASGNVFGPFVLDADYTCDQNNAILQAAIRAADSTVDFTAYQRVFLILPTTGSCTWAGLGQMGCYPVQSPSKGSFTASVTWIMTNPSALRGISNHEGGHNFGLSHARSLDYDTAALGPPGTDGTHTEYGDRFSTMGSNAGHFAAPHKNLLGWLPQGTNWLQVESNATLFLAPLSQTSSSLQALRIRRGTGNNQWLWVEYRQPVGSYDSTLNSGAFAGALIHLDDPGQSSWALYTDLLHFKPVHAPNNFDNAALNAGGAWNDPYSDLTLVIGSATPSGLTVTASYATSCATLSSPSGLHGPLGEAGQIGVSAPPGCSWTAIAAANWITITSGQSGNGFGTVSYSVAPNPDSTARTATIVIARQNFTVTQAPLPQAVSVTPASGNGSSQTFAFLFTDSLAYTGLTSAEVNINATQNPASSCYIRWAATGSLLYLRNDTDTSWLGPVPVGGSATLQNAQCALSPGGSSTSGSGVSLTLNLAIAFKAGFAGAKNVYMQTQSAAAATGWQQRGAWTVNAAPAMISVSPSSGSGNTQSFTFTIANVHANESVSIVFGPSSSISNACALYHSAGSANLWLYNDAGSSTAWTGIGTGPPVENSQCIVNGAGSSSVLTGSDLVLTVAITFKVAFAGQKNVYMSGYGQLYTPYQLRGTWTVVTGPSILSITPGNGTGASQTFAAVFSDPVSYTNLTVSELSVGGTANACYVKYDFAANALSLRNDAGDSWLTPLAPGSAASSANSQCFLNGPGTSVSGSGAALTVSLALSFRSAFSGARTISSRTQNASSSTGWQNWGVWTVNAAPAMVSVSPSSGSGNSQVFTFTMANATTGMWGYIVFGTSASTVNSCSLYYQGSGNGLALYNDAGNSSSWSTFGSGPPVENGQCILNGASSSSVLNGSDLTLRVAITFKAAFAGTKNVYMSGSNTSYTPYQLRGTWSVVAGPAVLSVTPGSGTGASQSFTGVFSDPAGYGNLSAADINVGGTANGCWVRYTPATNSLALRNDADNAWLAPVTPGAGTVSANAQCILGAGGSSATGSGSSLTVVLALSFRSAFAGVRTVSAQASNTSSSPGWQQWGTWTVNTAPAMIGVSPGSASGNSQVFTFSFGNVTTTTWLYVIFGTGTSSANSCALSFYPQNSGLYLSTDSGSSNYYAFNSSTPAQNSQCSISPAASSLALSGSDATATVAVTFKTAYAGLKNIYMSGNGTLYTPYLQRGTYLVTLAGAPLLGIAKSHTGNFTQGQSNAKYTVTVSNAAGAGPTSGTVTVTETVPTGMTLVSMAGTGWVCAGNTCTRNDALAPGSSFSAITVAVNVAASAAAQVINQAGVSGGGSVAASAGDVTTISALTATVTATQGSGQSAQVNQAFTTALQATVKDAGGNPVPGVTVTFTAPSLASGTFAGGGATATAVTNASGVATAPAFTANSIVGSYVVTASVAGVNTPATFVLTNTLGSGCAVNLDQTNVNIPADPNTVIFTVTAPGACAWTVQSNVPWANFIVSALREVRNSLTLSGTRALAIDIRRNTSSVAQSGTIVVNGSALTIHQAGSTDASNLRFVYAMFNNFLAREPGQAGVDFFLPLLNSGTLGRSQMAYNMFSAAEFNLIERYVIGLYYGILGRDPDYYGWDFHRRNMHLGVVQQDTLARDFLNSAEYALRYGNPTNAGFVQLMYQNALGRTPTAPDLAYWQGLLDNNTATRVQVAQAILNSPEFQQGHSTRQTIFLMHATMLSREPGDFGYQYWMDNLNGGMPLSTAVNAFVFSPEFQLKLGQ